MSVSAYAAHAHDQPLVPFKFDRREPGEHDVEIAIAFCGVCHSDIHTVRDEWGGAKYPIVPGHEIVGQVTRVGASVTKVKVGDRAAVGCMVESCRSCDACKRGEEQYCGSTSFTYNSTLPNGEVTQGGYSSKIVVNEDFTLRLPDNLDLAAAAPLLCAGITVWSPLRHWKVQAGSKVGVVGLGGLGHMAVKLANALGAEVTVLTTSVKKVDDAKRLGAKHVIVSTDKTAMDAAKSSLDFIIDTVSAQHEIPLSLLKYDGTCVMVGVPEHPLPVKTSNLIFGRRNLSGSLIGGVAQTQEMLDFCGKHNIVADIELINIKDINTAYERVIKSDVKYRFVIDLKTL